MNINKMKKILLYVVKYVGAILIPPIIVFIFFAIPFNNRTIPLYLLTVVVAWFCERMFITWINDRIEDWEYENAPLNSEVEEIYEEILKISENVEKNKITFQITLVLDDSATVKSSIFTLVFDENDDIIYRQLEVLFENYGERVVKKTIEYFDDEPA